MGSSLLLEVLCIHFTALGSFSLPQSAIYPWLGSLVITRHPLYGIVHVKSCSAGSMSLVLSRCGLLILFIAIEVIHMLSSPWASLAQESAMSTPHKWNRNKYYRETSKKSSSPLVTQLGEEAMCKKREACAEKISNKANSC